MVKKRINDITFPIQSVIALVLGIFIVGTEELVVSPILIDIANSFNTTVDIIALSISIFGLAVIIGAPLSAVINEKVSWQSSLLFALVLFELGTIFCALSSHILTFFFGRALAGLATGIFVPTAYSFVGDQIPRKYQGRVMGLVVSSWSLSLILGVPIGSFIGDWMNWRMVFVLLLIMGSFVILLLFSDYKRTKTALTTTVKGEIPIVNRNGISFFTAFMTPKVPTIIMVTFCNMVGFYGMYTYLGSFVRSVFPVGSSLAGLIIIIYGIGFSTSSITGKYTDVLGKTKSLVGAMGILSFIILILPYTANFILVLFVILFIWGTLQSFTVTLLSSLLNDISILYRGRILAIYSFATNLAVTLGSSLIGPIYLNYGYSKVGLLCAVISIVGFIVSLFINKSFSTRARHTNSIN